MTTPPKWASPARFLAPLVPAAPAAAAPERADRLAPAVREVKFHITDGGVFDFCYVPNGKLVRVSRKALEIIWASSSAYFVMYQRVFDSPPEENLGSDPETGAKTRVVDFDTDPEASTAVDLLRWAMTDWIERRDSSWPEDLPRPVDSPDEDTLEYAATQLALIAIAYLLFHELAHHSLKHEESDYEEEKDADRSAAESLVADLEEHDERFVFRSWGISIALSLLSAYQMHVGRFSTDSHPRAFDRLFHVLECFVSTGHHPAWGMAMVILRLHLDMAGIEVPTGAGLQDAHEVVDLYIEHLADWERDRSEG